MWVVCRGRMGALVRFCRLGAGPRQTPVPNFRNRADHLRCDPRDLAKIEVPGNFDDAAGADLAAAELLERVAELPKRRRVMPRQLTNKMLRSSRWLFRFLRHGAAPRGKTL